MRRIIEEMYTLLEAQKVEVYKSHNRRPEAQLAGREGSDVWFIREKYKDPAYGYKWTPWRRSNEKPYFEKGTPSWEYYDGPNIESKGWLKDHYAGNVRLPKG